MKALLDSGLWPLDRILGNTAISSVLELMDDSVAKNHSSLSAGPGCNCYPPSLCDKLSDVANKQRYEFKGLCLTCVKAGKFSAKAGNCRNEAVHSDTVVVESDDEDDGDEDQD